MSGTRSLRSLRWKYGNDSPNTHHFHLFLYPNQQRHGTNVFYAESHVYFVDLDLGLTFDMTLTLGLTFDLTLNLGLTFDLTLTLDLTFDIRLDL